MKSKAILVLLLICFFGLPEIKAQTATNATKAPATARKGVLLLAHGGSVRTWNEEVHHVADVVDLTVPTEIALGMANRSTIQEGVNRLIARGVTEIIAVPLFVSSHSSVIDSTAYFLGEKDEAPEDLKSFARMDHGHSSSHSGAHSGMMHDDSDLAEKMKPIESSVPIHMASALDHDEIIGDILRDRAASISRDPSKEVVILVAHGPVPDEDNKLWLADMNILATQIKKYSPYAGVECVTLRDDADKPVRDAATQQLRETVERILKAGQTPLIVPLLLSYGGIEEGLRKRLDGLAFKMPGQALLPDSRIAFWVTRRAYDTTADTVARKPW